MYSLFDDGMVYNDDAVCLAVGIALRKKSLSEIEPDFYANLYPNPATSTVTLTYRIENQNSVNELLIVDMVGKVVFTSKLNSNQNEFNFNVSDLNEGVYVYKIVSDNFSIDIGKISVIH